MKPPTRLKNRTAAFEFSVGETVSCGVVLTGLEVKAIRAGRADLTGAFARLIPTGPDRTTELWLFNFYIEGSMADSYKLLVTKRQLEKFIGLIQAKNQTLVATTGFFKGGYFKVDVGLGQRLKKQDRREKLREREMRHRAALEV